MNVKISVLVICVESIIYLFVYNLHDCTFRLLTIQSKFMNLCFITKRLIHVTYKVQSRFGNLKLFMEKIDSCEIKGLFMFLNYFKNIKAVHKNNPRTQSPQQYKRSHSNDSCLL